MSAGLRTVPEKHPAGNGKGRLCPREGIFGSQDQSVVTFTFYLVLPWSEDATLGLEELSRPGVARRTATRVLTDVGP